MKICPVVLSGGVGSRLWPLSREHFPKQCLNLTDLLSSLLQQTLVRTNHLNVQSPLVVCNDDHRFLIAQQLQDMGVTGAKVMLEPVGRNTAPAVALAAFEVLQSDNEDVLMLVLPADHVIRDTAAFEKAIAQAKVLAEAGGLVTFGITPTR
ncbi:sugar phosphate nucleotidyltransferase, partial [Vibrio fujianensis]|uniref:sugar phosphate nucleotidyltransferase n=1 Tax=Vibrio fujianensis TaxID=1974215 RepID=UPI001FE81537